MKNLSLKFVFLLFILSLGYVSTTKISIIYCQNNLVASTDIYIEHTSCGDLIVDIGVGNPTNPDWSINIWNKEESGVDNLHITIDLSEAVEYLPPSENNRWFLRVYDANNENEGQIAEFSITYADGTYASTCIPVLISDLQTTYSYIPGVPLDLAISRRISIRDFPSTDDYSVPEVPWKLLSKVLWAGYGYSSWERTVPKICGNYPLKIYVCNKTAAYLYNPATQALELWKIGDYRFYGIQGQHPAPIELFIAWDTTRSSDSNSCWEETGCIIQNIYLQANALGLGTVCTSGYDEDAVHEALELPSNEVVLYNMPLGHPEPASFYNFTAVYPPGSSGLPQVRQSSVFLEDALREIRSSHDWSENPLTRQEISQILWSAYGRSYLEDMRPSFWSFQYQHRTVPSAHGEYSLSIFMVDSTGIYSYDYWNHRLISKIAGDKRAEIAEATGATWIASSPAMLLVVWNSSEVEDPTREDYAYTEAGFIIQNVHLECSAWGLIADWTNIADQNAIKTILDLNDQTDIFPLSIITVGHPAIYKHKVWWDGVSYPLSFYTNYTITNVVFDQPNKKISFDISGSLSTIDFCNITIPKSLLRGDFTVLINGDPPSILTKNDNATHTSLYFKSEVLNNSKVQIISDYAVPEFLTTTSMLILLIFMFTLLIYKRKNSGKF